MNVVTSYEGRVCAKMGTGDFEHRMTSVRLSRVIPMMIYITSHFPTGACDILTAKFGRQSTVKSRALYQASPLSRYLSHALSDMFLVKIVLVLWHDKWGAFIATTTRFSCEIHLNSQLPQGGSDRNVLLI
jgi:hypothetical protein